VVIIEKMGKEHVPQTQVRQTIAKILNSAFVWPNYELVSWRR